MKGNIFFKVNLWYFFLKDVVKAKTVTIKKKKRNNQIN